MKSNVWRCATCAILTLLTQLPIQAQETAPASVVPSKLWPVPLEMDYKILFISEPVESESVEKVGKGRESLLGIISDTTFDPCWPDPIPRLEIFSIGSPNPTVLLCAPPARGKAETETEIRRKEELLLRILRFGWCGVQNER